MTAFLVFLEKNCEIDFFYDGVLKILRKYSRNSALKRYAMRKFSGVIIKGRAVLFVVTLISGTLVKRLSQLSSTFAGFRRAL